MVKIISNKLIPPAMKIPRSHPRYRSLATRELLVRHTKTGLLAQAGLIAHGRGEAFDYLLGEKTITPAAKAEKAAVALLLQAKNPVISVNGNTAALAAVQVAQLAKVTEAKVEINMFHWSARRGRLLSTHLKKAGIKQVLFADERRIPGLDHARAKCSLEGIFSADVVLVPLEDGDRAGALVQMGKKVIAIDLNPLSRTSRSATITIVDEVARALCNMTKMVKIMKQNRKSQEKALKGFSNKRNLAATVYFISRRLQKLSVNKA